MSLVSSDPLDLASCWEEDRKYILRGWALVFNILAILMVLSVADGRMAHVQGAFSGYLGIWNDCQRHRCANLGKVTVLLHMSTGFMVLALILSLVLLCTMGFSFHTMFRRLNKVDAIFSFLSFMISFLIALSLMLFMVTCETLRPKPQVSYLVATYLCWAGVAMMLWAGSLSYLNHAGLWSKGSFTLDRRLSYRRWAKRQSTCWRKSTARPLMESRVFSP